MASKKQKTSYASKLKEDPDLSSPLHDEIQMWAMKNKTALYSKLLSMTTTSLSWFDDRKKAYLVKNLSCQVEYPVKSHLVSGGFGKSIVGFMDVVLYLGCIVSTKHFSMKHGRGTETYEPFSFFIEIKSKITSFGEIMRELQFYDTHLVGLPKNHIVLLAPSIPFADMIREQGFTVLEYKADLFEVERKGPRMEWNGLVPIVYSKK